MLLPREHYCVVALLCGALGGCASPVETDVESQSEALLFRGATVEMHADDGDIVYPRDGEHVEYNVLTLSNYQLVDVSRGCPIPCLDEDYERLKYWGKLWVHEYALEIRNSTEVPIEAGYWASLDCVFRYGPDFTWDSVPISQARRSEVRGSIYVAAGDETTVSLACPAIADGGGAADVTVKGTVFDNYVDAWR